MNVCYYFFKEQVRYYDKADVLAFFQSMKEFKIEQQNEEYHLIYTNEFLDFSAKFILGNKSVVPHIEKLNPAFYDINIRLEVPVLLPTFKASILFDICKELCQKFNFYIYNELYEDVSSFRLPMLVQAYNKIKQAYKMKYEDEFLDYYKASAKELDAVFSYLLNKTTIETKYKDEKLIALDYAFLAEKGDRNIKFAVRYDGFSPFILPPFVNYIIYMDKDIRYISASEFLNKCGKIIKMAETNVFGVTYITLKDMKKVRKILKKTKFTLIPNTFIEVDQTKLLDL